MRISDWSSDVCSSDLPEQPERQGDGADDQALALVLLPLRGRGGILHGEAWLPALSSVATRPGSTAAASSSRSSGKAPSCSAGELVNSHRSEEHTSELQSLMRISYAVFCLKKKTKHNSRT